ncbi:hypothetical protein RRG08_039066 [Elysia crispata]|uniref:Uncharacterized protein n=1 Tax=Elysia crispata TaxID=231223 RepID=A0AAE1CZ60_9GAST|nr:hypothetical protein RRG08_039066 [Elysia crispata]
MARLELDSRAISASRRQAGDTCAEEFASNLHPVVDRQGIKRADPGISAQLSPQAGRRTVSRALPGAHSGPVWCTPMQGSSRDKDYLRIEFSTVFALHGFHHIYLGETLEQTKVKRCILPQVDGRAEVVEPNYFPWKKSARITSHLEPEVLKSA